MEKYSRNPTIDTMLNHASCRKFTDEKVSDEDIAAIFKAAQSASTSCFLQVTSIIRITDWALKEKIAVLAGNQKHVAQAPELWIFCADYHRNQVEYPESDLGWNEQFLVGVQDAGIMAQNAFAALESLGLGGCYIGGIRNGIQEIDRLLALPKNVFPVFGLAFGHPAEHAGLKPRMPAAVTFMENRYREPDPEVMQRYNDLMRQYYESRSSNAKSVDWTENMIGYMKKEKRTYMKAYVQGKGWDLK